MTTRKQVVDTLQRAAKRQKQPATPRNTAKSSTITVTLHGETHTGVVTARVDGRVLVEFERSVPIEDGRSRAYWLWLPAFYQSARGVLPVPDRSELPEVTIRRGRGA